MPSKDPAREEALSRLSQRADALQTRTAAASVNPAVGAGSQAVGQAYRIIAILFAGPIVGLALGWAVGTALHALAVGLIGGVLLGFVLALWLAWRTANELMAQARAEEIARGGPAPSVSDADLEQD